MTFPKYLNLRSFISEENEEVWNHLFFIPALKIDASMMLCATLEMRGNLGRVKFAKTSGIVTGGREKNWPIADWHIPRNDPRVFTKPNSVQFPSLNPLSPKMDQH